MKVSELIKELVNILVNDGDCEVTREFNIIQKILEK